MMKKIIFLIGIITLLYSCKTASPSSNEAENIITYNEPLTSDFSKVEISKPRNIPDMYGVSPKGDKITVNSQYLTLNDKPWIPSYGEFHYQRYPADQWEDALLKMKAQGFPLSYQDAAGYKAVINGYDALTDTLISKLKK